MAKTNMLALLTLALFLPQPVAAQVESNFSAGGGVRIGHSTSTCNAGIVGAIRYNSTSGGGIDFCNGSAWANVSSGGGSIDSLSDAETDYATDFNMFLGVERLPSATGQYNLGIGQAAGDSITTGDNNIAIGHSALTALTTTSSNIAISQAALLTSTGSFNIGIGYNALLNNAVGDSNVAIGHQAASGSADRYSIVAIGAYADAYAAGTAVGTSAYGPDSSVAIGFMALNTANGKTQFTAVGHESMRYADDTATATVSYNTALGYRALMGSTTASANTGTANTAIGHSALLAVTSGSNNISVGDRASDNITSGSNNITIGSNIDVSSATGSNQLTIGNTIYGDLSDDRIGIGKVPDSGVELDIVGDIQYTGTSTDISDRRLKTDIVALNDSGSLLERIGKIDTYSFRMKNDPKGAIEFGVMAQDLKEIFPELVVTNAGTPEGYMSVNYVGLIAPLIAAVQEQQEMIDRQETLLQEQQAQIDALLKALPAATAQQPGSLRD